MPEIMRCEGGTLRLSTVAQVAEMESTTGILFLGEDGEIHLRDGVPIAARLRGHSGVDALLELFLDPPGPMRLVTAEVAAHPPLGTLMGLVMEGCRLSDEWERLAPLVLKLARPAQLDPALGPIAPLLTGSSPLWVVMSAVDILRAPLVGPLAEQIESEVLEQAGEPVLPLSIDGAPLPRDAGSDTWLSLGRRLSRAGRYQEAVSAFFQAVRIDPESRVARQNLTRASQLASQVETR